MVGSLIVARRRLHGLSQSQLAAATGINQTYISRVERGEVEVPQRATLEKFGAALGISLPDFYRAAGMLEGAVTEDSPTPFQLPLSDPDEQFDPAAIVAYVESRPGDGFQRRLQARRERLNREAYTRFCVSLFRAWSSNSHLALEAAELSEQPR